MRSVATSALALASLLAACSTPADLRSSTATAEFQSTKTPLALATCIANAWESAPWWSGGAHVSMRATEGGHTVLNSATNVFGVAIAQQVAEIRATPDGATVTVHEHVLAPSGYFRKTVEDCARTK